ncbi:MAG TPA: alpha/beta fold hydrolase [Ktedonobacterales bacterium]|nr:alpha/beta fold hydrolase [Ktedonobacterales bacterium]
MAEFVEQPVRFPSAGQQPLLLEGILARPASESGSQRHAVAVLCHPQPASTSMDDTLVRRLAGDLAAAGLVTLRFNFRGVGGSEGQPTDGRLEPLDIAGAVDFVLEQPDVNPEKLCLLGHAFGAYMVLTYAAHDSRVRTVVAISPPMFRLRPELGAFDRPRLFVTGEFDEVSPRHKLEPWIERLPAGRALRVVTGARHLMRGYEDVASGTIVKYIEKWAMTPGV